MSIDVSRLSPWAQKQIARKIAIAETAKRVAKEVAQEKEKETRSKYGNQPTERVAHTTGKAIKFDSKKEAARYDELMLLLKVGKIRNLKLQPQYTLQEAYTTPDGERVRAVKYIADFSYEREEVDYTDLDCNGNPRMWPAPWKLVVEDIKGGKATKTKVYAIKKKLLKEKFGITITEV